MRSCPSCHESVDDSARFCPACGARLGEAAKESSERRLVTILFADLVGSTQLTSSLDAEAVRETARGWFARVRAEVEKHGGRVEKFAGDGVMAIFGVPQLHDDDAARCARAALDIVDVTARYAASLSTRISSTLSVRLGMESGEVVIATGSGDQFIATGIAVNTAARLQGLAAPDRVLVGPNAARLLEGWADLGVQSAVQLKGLDYPVEAYDLVTVHSHLPDRPGRHSLPFTGRAADLALLRAIAAQAQSTKTAHVVALIGPAGVGKSRLVHQATLGVDALVVRGRCPSYGDANGLYPIAQLINDVAGFIDRQPAVDELRAALAERLKGSSRADEAVDVLCRLDDLYGVTPPQTEDVVWAMRELVATLGRERLLVVVVEDIHWATERLIRVMSRVASEVRDSSVLVVFTARPEITDQPATWITSGSNSHIINLAPLSSDDVRGLIREVDESIDDGVALDVVAAAEGNPLFVTMLLQAEWLGSDKDLPLGVVALANARLHQLPEAERLLLGRAAIFGRVFYPRGVAALDVEHEADVPVLLESLKRRRLIHDAVPDLADEAALSFDHALLQEAAYRQLPKTVRLQLHSAAAEWLGSISQHPSTLQAIAHHRHMAVEQAVELDTPNDVLVDLRESAAEAAFDAAHSLDATSSGAAVEYLRACLENTSDLELRAKAIFDLLLHNDETMTAADVEPSIAEAFACGREDLGHLLEAELYYSAAGSANRSWADVQIPANNALTFATARGQSELILRALIAISQAEQQLAPSVAVAAVRHARLLIGERDNLLASSTANLVLGTAANLNESFEEVQRVVNEILAVTSSFRVEDRAISVLARFAASADQVEDLDVLLKRHAQIVPRLRPLDVTTNIAFILAPALAVVERHEDALAMWDEVGPQIHESFGHDAMASVWPEQALSLIELGRVSEARPLCAADRRTTAPDDDFGLAEWHAACARLAAADRDLAAVHLHVAEGARWIDRMALGGGIPQRLRLELARALADAGDLVAARAMAVQSRDEALALGALAYVRRADAILGLA